MSCNVAGQRDLYKVERWQKARQKISRQGTHGNERDWFPHNLAVMSQLKSEEGIQMCDIIDRTWGSGTSKGIENITGKNK